MCHGVSMCECAGGCGFVTVCGCDGVSVTACVCVCHRLCVSVSVSQHVCGREGHSVSVRGAVSVSV